MESRFLIFKEVFVETFSSIANLKLAAAKCLILPIFALAFIDSSIISYLFSSWIPVLLLLKIVFYTLIAVTTHRIILLGPESVSIWGIYKWGRRETYFALYVLLLALVMIPLEFLGMFSGITSVIATIIALWVAGRFALVFPGIAIDERFTFELSRIRTQKYNLLMFTIVGIIPILFFWVSAILGFEFFQSRLLFSFFTSVFLIFEISLVSNAYKSIHKRLGYR
jgi:hypothetical protein